MRSLELGSLVLCLVCAAVAGADDSIPGKPVPQGWGTSSYVEFNIHAFEFVPIDSSTTFTFTNWMKYITSGYPALTAGVHLPSGAKLGAFWIYACDDDSGSNLSAKFWRCPLTSTACDSPFAVAQSVSTGCDWWGSGSVSYTVDNANYSYFVEFNPTVLSSAHRLRHAEFFYQLQVSPAPGTATFADVPTSHPFFQYVEALAASGITAGCGGGNYCPNDALTRGQMAVFLSKALGLHWPY
ncbi:MAG: S-layer homology domain-containing protein [Acidobacteriota bacterium]